MAVSACHGSSFAAFADDHFYMGDVVSPSGERRLITSHSGDTLTLDAPFAVNDVGVGTEVDAFPGCDLEYLRIGVESLVEKVSYEAESYGLKVLKELLEMVTKTLVQIAMSRFVA